MSSELRPSGSRLKKPSRSLSEGCEVIIPLIAKEGCQTKRPVFKKESSYLSKMGREYGFSTPGIRKVRSELSVVAAVNNVSEKLKIGNKVLINASNKVGVVQFIGETKFAKGIWIGVTLDDVSGKNDGSVSGIRYFTCPPLQGLFVKEEKVTKVREELSLEYEQALNVGDEVYITSSNGTRGVGFLCYIGEPEFAKGIWYGVRLHEPIGKNDGTVGGTRYFQCKPKHGIFAQSHKIKKCRGPNSNEPPPLTKIATEIFMHANEIRSIKENIKEKSLDSNDVVLDKDYNKVQLKEMVISLQKEKIALKNEVDVFKHKIEDLQFQVEESMMTNDEMSNEPGNNKSTKVRELELKLSTQEGEILKLQREVEDMRTQHEEDVFLLDEKDAVIQSKDESTINYEVVIRNITDGCTIEGSDVKILLQRIDSLERKIMQMKVEHENRLNEKESTIFSLKEDLMALENKLSSLFCEIEEKSSAITNLKDQIGKMINDMEERTEKEHELIDEIKDLNDRIHIKQTEMASILSSSDVLHNENLELKVSLEILELRNMRLIENNSKLGDDNSDNSIQQFTRLHEQLEVKNREIISLKDQKNVLMAENNKLVQQLGGRREKVERKISTRQKDRGHFQ